MAALLLAVPTVLTLPADGRPDSALKPQILGDQTEHEATAPDEQAAGSNASARAGWLRERVPDGFTSTETCQEDCYTYAGDWTEKCLWNNSEGNGVHCEGCEQCTGAAAAPVADNSTNATAPTELEKENAELKKKLEAMNLEKENAELKKKLEAAEKASMNASQPAASDNATAPDNATKTAPKSADDIDKKKPRHVHG